MKMISQPGIDLIQSFEGCTTHAYQDQRGVWTIGSGHTVGVKAGDVITPEQAGIFLADDLEDAEACVNNAVPATLTQNQFDACVSLAFNIGCHSFSESTLVELLKEGKITWAAAQFLVWDKTNGQVNVGLARRRRAEQKMFLGLNQ